MIFSTLNIIIIVFKFTYDSYQFDKVIILHIFLLLTIYMLILYIYDSLSITIFFIFSSSLSERLKKNDKTLMYYKVGNFYNYI